MSKQTYNITLTISDNEMVETPVAENHTETMPANNPDLEYLHYLLRSLLTYDPNALLRDIVTNEEKDENEEEEVVCVVFKHGDDEYISDHTEYPAKFGAYNPKASSPLYNVDTFGKMRCYIRDNGKYNTLCHLIAIDGIGDLTASAIVREANATVIV